MHAMKLQTLLVLLVALFAGAAWAAAPTLHSKSVLVIDETTGKVLHERNADALLSIASITKLMTAIVVLDAKLPLDERVTIVNADVQASRKTRSLLDVGLAFTREDLIDFALIASDNRAAAALARAYPGGADAFINAMNQKAKVLGLKHTAFVDSSGLAVSNVSTARELATLVRAAHQYPLIRQFSSARAHDFVFIKGLPATTYDNSNALTREAGWNISLSKTGYIRDAGWCLVMMTRIDDKPVLIVQMGAPQSHHRLDDARALRRWIEGGASPAGKL